MTEKIGSRETCNVSLLSDDVAFFSGLNIAFLSRKQL